MLLLKKSINQKANRLPGMLGLLLHSTHIPENVIETMARMGLSISVDGIHDTIHSLSAQLFQALQRLSQTLLPAYAYNNFNVSLKTTVPTAEKSINMLKHLTSSLLFPLQHRVTHDNLKCLYELWWKSWLNPHINANWYATRIWRDILSVHPNTQDVSGLHQCECFISWKFLHDLCYHRPAYFTQFQSCIPDPEVIEQIPVIKTPVMATFMMDVNNSMV